MSETLQVRLDLARSGTEFSFRLQKVLWERVQRQALVEYNDKVLDEASQKIEAIERLLANPDWNAICKWRKG